MTSATKFSKKTVDSNLLDEVQALRRRVARLETRLGKDAQIMEAADVVSFDPTAAVIKMVNPTSGTATAYTNPDTGAFVAGGGTVVMSGDGISITAPTGDYTDTASYKFTSGANKTGELANYTTAVAPGSTYVQLYATGNPTNGQASVTVGASADSTNNADVSLLTGQNGAATLRLKLRSDTIHQLELYAASDLWHVLSGTANQANILNEQGADVDTRIEGDADANLIYCDASADMVGIGKNNPAVKLDVVGAINATGLCGLAAARSGTTGALDDDTVYSFTPPTAAGAILIYGGSNANEYTWAYFNTNTPATYAFAIGSATVVGTGALTDGTSNGTDAKLNVNAHTDGKIYIKNRTGSAKTYRWLLI